MPILTIDQLAAAQLRSLMVAPITKASLTAVANRLQSIWVAGTAPATGAAPGAAAIPTKATTGALANFPAVTGGLLAYADMTGLANAVAGTAVFIYDRLSHMSGLSGTSTSGQNVNTTVPDRGDVANYSNIFAFVEVYTATGSTATTITLAYTSGGGAAGRSSGAFTSPASMAAGNMLLMPFQAGDQSVRSVQTATLTASTATAGNFGVTLARLVASWTTTVAGVGPQFPLSAMGDIPENACLWAVVVPPSTASGAISGAIRIIQG